MAKDTQHNPIDWPTLLLLTNNKPELAKELVRMFGVELPNVRTEINKTFEREDYSQLQELIHKLHGSCCYTGVNHLKKIASSLEDELKINNNNVADRMKALNDEIDSVLEAIKNQSYINETT